MANCEPTTDPAEVPNIKSAPERSRPASASPASMPDSQAIPTGPPPPKTNAFLGMAGSVRIKSLGQLDARASRIENERNFHPSELRHFAIRQIEWHALSLQVLAESFQACNLESNVVERAPLRRGRRGIGFAEIHFATGQHGRFVITAFSGFSAECSHIPGSQTVCIGGDHMDVMESDGRVQRSIFGELYPHFFGKFRDKLFLRGPVDRKG